MNIRKLNEELEKFCLNEMAMAWADRKTGRCVWVENPNNHNNKYFKYLNSFSYQKATKVARISLLEPKYLKHSGSKKDWKLTNTEKQELIKLMNMDSRVYEGLTNWQATLVRYNFDNFYIDPLDTINSTFDIQEFPDAFSIDYSMPDYSKLN